MSLKIHEPLLNFVLTTKLQVKMYFNENCTLVEG